MLGSLKAYYRKLRTFKGTIRALINLRRTPLSLSSAVKAASSVSNGSGDLRRNSAVLEVPRISAAGASTVQSQVQKLVAEGRVVAEVDRTSGMEVTYRQQGNLDHYTEDNLAKRVSLQQDPHMIALTQRLWNCALRNGDKKLKYGDYETYMLCLHRLILPEFDIAASKELIADDWKRDSGEQDYLDYAFFHLSMFELVDLWTDTVDPEDYISLLYCITHCLTYLLNEHHMLKSLIDVSNVDILKESKGVTLEIIKEDLQRELNGESFAYFRDQVRLVTEANQAAEREVTGTSRPRRVSQSQQGNRSRSRDRKRSTSRSGEKDNFPGGTTTDLNSQHRRSRSGSSDFGQDPTKRKFSVQASANSLYLTANASGFGSINGGAPPLTTQTQNYPADAIPVSPRREVALQRATSPNVFARGGGVILNIGTMDGMVISMSTADGKSSAAVSTTGNAAFPRRRSRSASNSSQQRRDQAMQTAGKMDITREAGLQVNHIEATKSVLRTGSQDPNAAGYILLPSASSGKSREPFTVRAAAVAVAAASMASAAAPVKPQQALSIQRTQFQVQQRSLQSNQDGIAASVVGGSTKNIPPNVFINNSSLTAPLMTIVSSKAPTPREATSSINKIQLQLQETPDPYAARPQTPHEGLLGASLSSPRASNAITAQAAGIFLSSQRSINPPSSPRPSLLTTQRPGSILGSDHQAPKSPRKLQQREESLSLSATSTSLMGLTISGRTAAQNNSVETPSALQRSKFEPGLSALLGDTLGSLLIPLGISDGITTGASPKDDLKALLSPRYIVTNPVASNHPAQLSSNLKQSSIRPQGSTRGFAKSSPRVRHQPSGLATGPASSHLQQQRQQRRPSELQGLAIAPGKFGFTTVLAYSEIMETEALGLRWWDEELLQTQVSFRTAFFPALLRSCDPQSLPSELSRDELRVVTQFCISPDANQSGQVTREDFRRFLARFGPLELSLSKLVACFCANQELVPWFHGDIGRQEAESVLAVRERSDGAFLVRFSESHPTKFTLTYLKVHSASSSTPGRRELKNCLVRNLGEPGYALSEASSSGRLKYGVASNFSAKCNQELAVVRAVQDHQSDSYSAFSTESFGTPEPPPGSASMLFSRSPPSQSFLGMPTFPLNANSKAETSSNSYASFIVDSLAPPTVHSVETQWQTAPASIVADKKPTLGNWNGGGVVSSPGPFGSSDYGNFASFAQHQPEEEAQPVAAKQAGNKNSPVQHHYRSPEASTSAEYGTFANLALTYAHESQQLAAQGHQTVSLSRSPTSTARTGFDTSGYGSFASVAITKPTSSTPVDAANSSRHQRSNNRGSSADNDYGSFASITNELEDKRPQWEQTLGPPPPPMAVKTSFDPQTTRPSNAIYENFASVSLAGHDARSQEKEPLHVLLEKPPARATPSPNSDVYGSFDAAAANPTIKTTPITSALDELNIGMEFYKQKRLDDALLRFILAQELARSTGDQVVEARALGNLGTVYLDKKNPQQAVRCYQQCLDITRAIEDTKRERTILNNLVLALVASEDFERALACCQVQLETTTNAINRRKIISRMSLLREKMTRQTSR
ncbi:hypothetical protein PRIC1_007520 [Phytophthora ramorum]